MRVLWEKREIVKSISTNTIKMANLKLNLKLRLADPTPEYLTAEEEKCIKSVFNSRFIPAIKKFPEVLSRLMGYQYQL